MKDRSHLLITGLIFLIFSLSVLTDSYAYFIENKYCEGYVLAVEIIFFDFIGCLTSIPFFLKKENRNLGVLFLFLALISINAFLDFSISLILTPLISLFASFYFLNKAFRKS